MKLNPLHIGLGVAVSILCFTIFAVLGDQSATSEQRKNESGLQNKIYEYADRLESKGIVVDRAKLKGTPAPGNQAVTYDEYMKLQNGISYRQAVSVVGADGEEISRNHMDGIPGVMESIDTVMYQWANGNGSNINAMFQNDKLISKAQLGIR